MSAHPCVNERWRTYLIPLTKYQRKDPAPDPDWPAVMDDAEFAEKWATLTLRQRQALRLRAMGLSGKETAERMGICYDVQRQHTYRGYTRLGIESGGERRIGLVGYLLGRHDARGDDGAV